MKATTGRKYATEVSQWPAWAKYIPPESGRRSSPQVFACDSSQSASVVKPTITASIQYCERTASRALS